MSNKCFAYKDGKCNALKIISCDGCGFFQTTKQVELGRKKAHERVMSLDQDVKDYILDKYYAKVGV